jgi:hypothetical protein
MYLPHHAWKKMFPGLQDSKRRYYETVNLYSKGLINDMRNVTATEINNMYKTHPCSPVYELGNCTSAPTPPVEWTYHNYDKLVYPLVVMKQEEGNNPMFATKTVQAVPSNGALAISVSGSGPSKSDEMTQREYLLGELRDHTQYEWQDEKLAEIRKLFNIDAPKYPKSSQELIDAFKNGKYTVDQAKVDKNTKFYAEQLDEVYDDEDNGIYKRFYGITFTDLPIPDHKGWEAAKTAYRKLVKDTERKIMVSSPADGLTALLALEAWTPTTAAS